MLSNVRLFLLRLLAGRSFVVTHAQAVHVAAPARDLLTVNEVLARFKAVFPDARLYSEKHGLRQVTRVDVRLPRKYQAQTVVTLYGPSWSDTTVAGFALSADMPAEEALQRVMCANLPVDLLDVK